MMKNNFLKTGYFLLLLVCGLFAFFGTQTAQAASPLELIINEPLFNVQNAAPGQSFSSPVTLLNHGDHHENFQFEIDMKTSSKSLTDHLFFKVTDDSNNCLYGCAGNVTLSYLDHREPDIARVGPHSTTHYKFVLTFDPNAGNKLQSAFVIFDMKLGFEGTITHRGGGGGNAGGGAAAGGPGAVAGGAGPTGIVGGAAGGTVGGAEVGQPAGETGQVQGEESPPGIVEGEQVSTCQSWPKWVWTTLLILYFVVFLWRTFEKIKQQIEKHKIHWKWQAVFAVAAFLVWYFFDKCREFQWFVLTALVGGIGIYFYYLYLFRKNIREKQADIENGSDREPPQSQEPPQPPANSDAY